MLVHYKLSQLQFIGTISQLNSHQQWALIKTPDSRVYSVTINSLLGIESGKVIGITPQRITVKIQPSEIVFLTLIKREPHENSEEYTHHSNDTHYS